MALSTAGITVQWAAETTSGTRPTTGYKIIAGVTSTPELNPDPSTLDVTPLEETHFTRYIAGLQDTGGSLSLGAFLDNALIAAWNEVITAHKAGLESGLAVVFAIVIPAMDNAFYIRAEPLELGISAAEVGSALSIDLKIVPIETLRWHAKPTT